MWWWFGVIIGEVSIRWEYTSTQSYLAADGFIEKGR